MECQQPIALIHAPVTHTERTPKTSLNSCPTWSTRQSWSHLPSHTRAIANRSRLSVKDPNLCHAPTATALTTLPDTTTSSPVPATEKDYAMQTAPSSPPPSLSTRHGSRPHHLWLTQGTKPPTTCFVLWKRFASISCHRPEVSWWPPSLLKASHLSHMPWQKMAAGNAPPNKHLDETILQEHRSHLHRKRLQKIENLQPWRDRIPVLRPPNQHPRDRRQNLRQPSVQIGIMLHSKATSGIKIVTFFLSFLGGGTRVEMIIHAVHSRSTIAALDGTTAVHLSHLLTCAPTGTPQSVQRHLENSCISDATPDVIPKHLPSKPCKSRTAKEFENVGRWVLSPSKNFTSSPAGAQNAWTSRTPSTRHHASWHVAGSRSRRQLCNLRRGHWPRARSRDRRGWKPPHIPNPRIASRTSHVWKSSESRRAQLRALHTTLALHQDRVLVRRSSFAQARSSCDIGPPWNRPMHPQLQRTAGTTERLGWQPACLHGYRGRQHPHQKLRQHAVGVLRLVMMTGETTWVVSLQSVSKSWRKKTGQNNKLHIPYPQPTSPIHSNRWHSNSDSHLTRQIHHTVPSAITSQRTFARTSVNGGHASLAFLILPWPVPPRKSRFSSYKYKPRTSCRTLYRAGLSPSSYMCTTHSSAKPCHTCSPISSKVSLYCHPLKLRDQKHRGISL